MNPSAVLLMLTLSFIAGGCLASAYFLGKVQQLQNEVRRQRQEAFAAGVRVGGMVAREVVPFARSLAEIRN